MTPRELIDRIVMGHFRQHAEALERQLLSGCSQCGAPLVKDGQPIDVEGTAITDGEHGPIVLCRKCCHFDEAIPKNDKLLDVLRWIDDSSAGERLTPDEETMEMLREARAGAMYERTSRSSE